MKIVKRDGHIVDYDPQKIRIAIGHKRVTKYLVTRFVVDSPDQLRDGQVIDTPDASHINMKLRCILNAYQEALDKINANAKAETKRLVNKAVDKANEIVEQIKQELKEADEKALLKAKKDLKRLESLAYDGGEIAHSVLTEEISESEIIPGAKIVVKSIGAEGYVARVRTDRKEAEVNCLGKSLKVKFADFTQRTRSISVGHELRTMQEILPLAKRLLNDMQLQYYRVRLMGLAVSNPLAEQGRTEPVQLSLGF